MKSSFVKAHLALFFVNALYGANHIIAKGVMPQFLTPSVFILFRVVGAVFLFWIVKLLTIKEKNRAKRLCSARGLRHVWCHHQSIVFFLWIKCIIIN